ncbi:hypothetical protein [uncultured Marivirga sp.]|uniref:hypothetical protein n=1 Tax=uncultured Marivirga sp. TaxID=1123707 RepID=UPI0030EBB0B6|tara:strand:- start:48353 stop:49270 length:918 start_codon:yes stop_codon:yes gene_type:complete
MRQNYQISEHFPSKSEEEVLKFSVFAQKSYWLLHLALEKILPITVYDDKGQIVAFWCFYKQKQKLSTPFNAPFFTPYFASEVDISLVCENVFSYCKEKYNCSIEFTLQSDTLSTDHFFLMPSLKIKKVDLASRLTVSDKSFVEHIRQERKKRKLKSLLSANQYRVSNVDIDNWADEYQENLNWRAKKSHQNLISVENMSKAKLQFPDVYHALKIEIDSILVGNVFFLKVNDMTLYVYSLIIDPSSNLKEPSLLLWNSVYNWAQQNGFSIIEMGTSMLPDGNINKNLARYKSYIGGEFYRKYTLHC